MSARKMDILSNSRHKINTGPGQVAKYGTRTSTL